MPEVFTYVFNCVKCNTQFKELKIHQYKKVHKNKICPGCKKKGDGNWVKDNEGEEGRRCGDCKHFAAMKEHGECWGNCLLGHKLENEADYAVDGEVFELVYFEDVCPDFDKEDG